VKAQDVEETSGAFAAVLASAVELGVIWPRCLSASNEGATSPSGTSSRQERRREGPAQGGWDAVPRKPRCLSCSRSTRGARAGEQLALQWGGRGLLQSVGGVRRAPHGRGRGRPRSGGNGGCLSRSLEAGLRGSVTCESSWSLQRERSALKIDQLHERLWGACRRAGNSRDPVARICGIMPSPRLCEFVGLSHAGIARISGSLTCATRHNQGSVRKARSLSSGRKRAGRAVVAAVLASARSLSWRLAEK